MTLIFFVLIVLCGPSVSAIEIRIINGSSVENDEFPFVVSLQNNGRHFCGGTVLNRKHILTAAHCICDLRGSNLTIYFSHNLENRAQIIPVKSINCHKDYSSIEHVNDIAILEMELEIPTNSYHPVKLVNANFSTKFDLNGTLVGWGLTAKEIRSNILMKVDVIAYNDTTCTFSHYGMYDMERNMCAGWPENGRGSCQGDSGGPLLIEGFQAGIISFGINSNCGISNRQHPKVLTRISKYIDWITENSKYDDIQKTDNGFKLKINSLLFCILILMNSLL